MGECKKKKQYAMRFMEGEKILQKEEIADIESYGRRLHFHVGNEEYLAYSKLDDTERHLNDRNFLRIHKSFLVNMRFIERINSYRVYLKTGCVLPIPKARYADVREAYTYWKELFVED